MVDLVQGCRSAYSEARAVESAVAEGSALGSEPLSRDMELAYYPQQCVRPTVLTSL
jgi:hypothetical protein